MTTMQVSQDGKKTICKKGSCSVIIYSTPTKGYDGFTLVYVQDGKRKRETSSDKAVLTTRAEEVLDDIAEGVADSVALKAVERNEYLKAVETLAPLNAPPVSLKVSVEIAVKHYAEAVKILGSDLVIQAAREYAARHAKIDPKLLAEVIDLFLEDKKQQRKSDRHLATLTGHLTRVKGSLGANMIASLTAQDFDLFLGSLKVGDTSKHVSPRTRDNFRNSIVTLLEWAKRKRFVPGDFDEQNRIDRRGSDEDGAIEIYSPKQMAALLSKADAKLRPFLAIGAFAGLRSSEIMRLDWSDVRTENGSPCIVVQRGKVKKRGQSRRIVPMTDNLKAFLLQHEDRKGKVWPFSVPYLYEMLRELAPKAKAALRELNPQAKLEWKPNALRHSFISYRVASIKNVPQVALESGNSPQMIFSNYRELVSDADASAWFAIVPEQAEQSGKPAQPKA